MGQLSNGFSLSLTTAVLAGEGLHAGSLTGSSGGNSAVIPLVGQLSNRLGLGLAAAILTGEGLHAGSLTGSSSGNSAVIPLVGQLSNRLGLGLAAAILTGEGLHARSLTGSSGGNSAVIPLVTQLGNSLGGLVGTAGNGAGEGLDTVSVTGSRSGHNTIVHHVITGHIHLDGVQLQVCSRCIKDIDLAVCAQGNGGLTKCCGIQNLQLNGEDCAGNRLGTLIIIRSKGASAIQNAVGHAYALNVHIADLALTGNKLEYIFIIINDNSSRTEVSHFRHRDGELDSVASLDGCCRCCNIQLNSSCCKSSYCQSKNQQHAYENCRNLLHA